MDGCGSVYATSWIGMGVDTEMRREETPRELDAGRDGCMPRSRVTRWLAGGGRSAGREVSLGVCSVRASTRLTPLSKAGKPSVQGGECGCNCQPP